MQRQILRRDSRKKLTVILPFTETIYKSTDIDSKNYRLQKIMLADYYYSCVMPEYSEILNIR